MDPSMLFEPGMTAGAVYLVMRYEVRNLARIIARQQDELTSTRDRVSALERKLAALVAVLRQRKVRV